MGNNYMNQPQYGYGGMRYSGRFGRYAGCRSGCAETLSDAGSCSDAVCARQSRMETDTCECTSPIDGIMACPGQVVAMAYVPVQEWGCLYDAEQGFCHGTLFKDLDKPFTGGRGV